MGQDSLQVMKTDNGSEFCYHIGYAGRFRRYGTKGKIMAGNGPWRDGS